MITSSILFPADCSPQALIDFEKLVVDAVTVDPEGLAQRIRDASRLLFLREAAGHLVAVGALKRPLSSYRRKVFAKAEVSVLSNDYRVELGWIAVAKAHQGRSLSRRIITELISLAGDENLFATTRADARTMRFAGEYGFQAAGRSYPSGRGYDLVLYLRDANASSASVADVQLQRSRPTRLRSS